MNAIKDKESAVKLDANVSRLSTGGGRIEIPFFRVSKKNRSVATVQNDEFNRKLYSYTWTWSIALMLGVLLVSYVTLSPRNVFSSLDTTSLADLMNKWGGVIQGTIGIAVAFAGVLVTVRIANAALQAAESAVAIAKEEQRRASERYAREIKVELFRFGREFGDLFGKFLDYFKSLKYSSLQDPFLARSIVVDTVLLGDWWESDGKIEKHAKRVADVLEDASKSINASGGDVYDTEGQYKEAAEKIRTALADCEEPPRSFAQVSGELVTITHARAQLKGLLSELKTLLEGIESKGFVTDLIYSDKKAQEALRWLRIRTNDLLRLIDDDDLLFDRLGRTLVISSSSGSNGRFGEENSPSIFHLLGFAALFSFFEQSTADAYNCHDDGLLGVSKAADRFLELFRALSAGKDKVVEEFSLGESGDSQFVPRSMLNYRPPDDLLHMIDLINLSLPLLVSNEKLRINDAGLCDDNPVKRIDESLDFWKRISKRLLYAE